MPLTREEWEKAVRKETHLSKEEFQKAKREAALVKSLENIEADKAKYDPTIGMSTADKFFAGVGKGMTGVGRRAVNLALPKSLEPEWAKDEAFKEADERDAALMNTGAGAVGNVVGQIAATAPLGGAIGAAGKGLAAARSLPALAKAGQAITSAGYGGRALAGGLEGAAQGVLTSQPGEGGKDTALGAGLGAGFGVLGKAGGQLLRKLRPEITPAAREVMEETGTFIPASHALPEGSIGRQINEGLMANLPGSGGTIRGQHASAIDDVRNYLTTKALPRGANTVGAFQPGDRMKDTVKELSKHWDTAYDDVYKQTIKNVSIDPEIAKRVASASGKTIKTGGDLTGREALDLSHSIQELIDEIPPGKLTRAARNQLIAARTAVENTIKQQLPANIRPKYLANAERYKTFLGVKNAASRATGGEFTLKGVARQLGKKGAKEENLALDAMETLKSFPSRQGIFQTAAALGTVGGAGILGASTAGEDATAADRIKRALMFAGGAYLGPKALATERAQKMLVQYGKEGLLDKYAKALRHLGSTGRAGAVTVAGDLTED